MLKYSLINVDLIKYSRCNNRNNGTLQKFFATVLVIASRIIYWIRAN